MERKALMRQVAESLSIEGTPSVDPPGENRDLSPQPVFPDEPYACPHCGQMLGASVRVCVACKSAIDPGTIRRTLPAAVKAEATATLPLPRAARFPWVLFIVFASARLTVAMVAEQRLGFLKTELALGVLELLSAVWIIYDARLRHIPKPWHWGLGSLFLWTIIFPWYLSRRKTPEVACPVVEGRGLLFLILIFVALGLVIMALGTPR